LYYIFHGSLLNYQTSFCLPANTCLQITLNTYVVGCFVVDQFCGVWLLI